MNSTSIWVQDPETGRELDIAPFFKLLNELDKPANSPMNTCASHVLRQAIRTLNVTVHDPQITTPLYLANLYRDLHLLEDMFEAIVERPLPD